MIVSIPVSSSISSVNALLRVIRKLIASPAGFSGNTQGNSFLDRGFFDLLAYPALAADRFGLNDLLGWTLHYAYDEKQAMKKTRVVQSTSCSISSLVQLLDLPTILQAGYL